MANPDWWQAEHLLFERSRAALKRFGREHPGEPVSLFAYTVDSLFAGVALNFDTPKDSLARAKDHQRRELTDRNRLFASDRSWEQARSFVADPTRLIDTFNRNGSWRYERVEFVPLPAWEEFFDGCDDHGATQLEGRVIAALWRVVDRLVETRSFDGLWRVAPFRVGFEFHGEAFVVLRILDWPVGSG